MIARLVREERGQASAELMGMVFWLLVATVVVWQLMLAAWTANQATNAARTASRVSARPDGDPKKAAAAILDVSEQCGADMIVVGNKGMTGARRFLLGSVPDKISHHASCGESRRPVR